MDTMKVIEGLRMPEEAARIAGRWMARDLLGGVRLHTSPNYTEPYRAVRVETLVDRNAAVARVSYGDFTATGSSKREPGDPFDDEIGEKLAVARAFQSLGDQIEAAMEAIVEAG